MGIEATYAKTLRSLIAAQQSPATRALNMGVVQTAVWLHFPWIQMDLLWTRLIRVHSRSNPGHADQ